MDTLNNLINSINKGFREFQTEKKEPFLKGPKVYRMNNNTPYKIPGPELIFIQQPMREQGRECKKYAFIRFSGVESSKEFIRSSSLFGNRIIILKLTNVKVPQ